MHKDFYSEEKLTEVREGSHLEVRIEKLILERKLPTQGEILLGERKKG